MHLGISCKEASKVIRRCGVFWFSQWSYLSSLQFHSYFPHYTARLTVNLNLSFGPISWMLWTTLCECPPEFNLSGVSHWSSSTSIFNLSCSQQPTCNLSRMYPLSSTQRCLTYKLHIAHAHAQQLCSVVTDI